MIIRKPLLSVRSDSAKPIQLRVVSLGDESAFAKSRRWVIANRFPQQLGKLRQPREAGRNGLQEQSLIVAKFLNDRGHRGECPAQRVQVAGRRSCESDACGDALDVGEALEPLANAVAHERFRDQARHGFLAAQDFVAVGERHPQPMAQLATADGVDGAIDGVEKTTLVGAAAERAVDLQRPPTAVVDLHEVSGESAPNDGDVGERGFLRFA